MNNHPYMRAYMAGVFLPTIGLLIALSGFFVARIVFHVPVPIERAIIFPMALVPNLWGVWNILYIALPPRLRLPLGFHGALLPILGLPLATPLAMRLNPWLPNFFPTTFFLAIPVAAIAYYLLWKYLLAFLNSVVGLGTQRASGMAAPAGAVR